MTTLKNVLLLNALSSAATGIGLIVFAPAIASLFNAAQTGPFYGTGIFLVAFAAFVLYERSQKPIRTGRILLISTLDGLWVLGSFAIVLLGFFSLSMIGYSLISGVAIWVAAMAYLQLKGIKQLTA